jgi:hypothetical protein
MFSHFMDEKTEPYKRKVSGSSITRGVGGRAGIST